MLTTHRIPPLVLIATAILAGASSRTAHAGSMMVKADAVRTDATDIDVSATFEGLEAQTFSFGPPNTFPLDVTFTILNGTGIDWTDFTISIVAAGQLQFTTPTMVLTVNSFTFAGPGGTGVLVPAGGTFVIPTDPFGAGSTLSLLNPNGAASVDVRLVPSIGIPEPSTLTLFGLGVLGVFGFAWRRRKVTAA